MEIGTLSQRILRTEGQNIQPHHATVDLMEQYGVVKTQIKIDECWLETKMLDQVGCECMARADVGKSGIWESASVISNMLTWQGWGERNTQVSSATKSPCNNRLQAQREATSLVWLRFSPDVKQ